jgi:hypothetical protein
MREVFLTGCDEKTEWQLPWFIHNFREHNPDGRLVLADFGMSDYMFQQVYDDFEEVFEVISEAKDGSRNLVLCLMRLILIM